MLIKEIMESASAGATAAGSIAPVVAPMGMQSRNGGSFFAGKYTNEPTPNTPSSMKKGKRRAK